MPDTRLFALLCPGCGASLKVSASLDAFACAYCGASVKLEQTESTVSLKLLADGLSAVQRGTDRTAAELAIRRLTDELKSLEQQRDELSSARLIVQARWNRQIDVASKAKKDQLLAGGVAVVTFVIVSTLLQIVRISPLLRNVVKVDSPVPAIVVGIVVAVIAGLYVWRTNMRGNKRIIARLGANRDKELEAHDQKANALQAKINLVNEKLAAHRGTVDS